MGQPPERSECCQTAIVPTAKAPQPVPVLIRHRYRRLGLSKTLQPQKKLQILYPRIPACVSGRFRKDPLELLQGSREHFLTALLLPGPRNPSHFVTFPAIRASPTGPLGQATEWPRLLLGPKKGPRKMDRESFLRHIPLGTFLLRHDWRRELASTARRTEGRGTPKVVPLEKPCQPFRPRVDLGGLVMA